MKIQNLSIFAVLAILSTSFYVLAQDGDRVPPCMQIKKACEKAGLHKKKARDCMKQVIAGEKVSGVVIDPKVVNNCKEKHEK